MDDSFTLTKEELTRIADLGGISWEWVDEDAPVLETEDELDDGLPMFDVPALLHEMAEAAFDEDPDGFARFAAQNKKRMHEAIDFAEGGERVAELVVLGYKAGISRGSGACMNDLGACYYMGEFVEQDYSKARDLYEAAASHGCSQGMINLGYIYEYGRTGEPDYARAYECYAMAAALEQSSEAVYKLGDMYSRGRSVKRDMGRACALWERSLELAQGLAAQAQPAVRIAKLLVDPECAEWGIEPDPMRALALFNTAELGLRIDIADGLVYYRKRLRETIEGQARARELLEGRGGDF